MTFPDAHNTFRAADAFEFTDAFRAGCELAEEVLRKRMSDLCNRIDGLAAPVPAYLLAAYRGYEAALLMKAGR